MTTTLALRQCLAGQYSQVPFRWLPSRECRSVLTKMHGMNLWPRGGGESWAKKQRWGSSGSKSLAGNRNMPWPREKESANSAPPIRPQHSQHMATHNRPSNRSSSNSHNNNNCNQQQQRQQAEATKQQQKQQQE